MAWLQGRRMEEQVEMHDDDDVQSDTPFLESAAPGGGPRPRGWRRNALAFALAFAAGAACALGSTWLVLHAQGTNSLSAARTSDAVVKEEGGSSASAALDALAELLQASKAAKSAFDQAKMTVKGVLSKFDVECELYSNGTTNCLQPGFTCCGKRCVPEHNVCCDEKDGLSCDSNAGFSCCGNNCLAKDSICCNSKGLMCTPGSTCCGKNTDAAQCCGTGTVCNSVDSPLMRTWVCAPPGTADHKDDKPAK